MKNPSNLLEISDNFLVESVLFHKIIFVPSQDQAFVSTLVLPLL